MNLYHLPQERKAIIATCNLNQWAMDFDDNLARIKQSIVNAKAQGAKLRLGPELEISGYSCEDHFLEADTFFHSYQSLASILSDDTTDGILCLIGCPVLFNNTRYNCVVVCLDRKIILIRPKMDLADDGNYREKRFFTSWKHGFTLQEFTLPIILKSVCNQETVPFGVAMVKTIDTVVAVEICEELWGSKSPHIDFSLAGAEIICNGSGSHHELRKLCTRFDLIHAATSQNGGVYVFSNHKGCDGNRLYFDGCSMIVMNGKLLVQAPQFGLKDVDVQVACINLDDVQTYRQVSATFQHNASLMSSKIPTVNIAFSLSVSSERRMQHCTLPTVPKYLSPEEECAMGPACWLWDYLRRSGASGYLLPLSGGADSSSSASIVRVMCGMAVNEARQGNTDVINDINAILKRSHQSSSHKFLGPHGNVLTTTETNSLVSERGTPSNALTESSTYLSAEELCSYILHTVYLGSENSSLATRRRSSGLAEAIGSYHKELEIDPVIKALLHVFSLLSGGKVPQFASRGGMKSEDIALQNIQARIRMVLAYLCAQLFPWLRGSSGYLLVLGSGNVDEALRGYMTKYDCSSADINPIGGICKGDLKKMLSWISHEYKLPIIDEIAKAPPTAELQPIAEGEKNDYTQTDEEDMGMSYEDLGIYGTLRKINLCGPVSMFMKLLQIWPLLSPSAIAAKVKRFFYFYSVNRHKMTTLTPSYHAESYSPDDNRFDLRQFLYNTKWTRQFSTIDAIVETLPSSSIDEEGSN